MVAETRILKKKRERQQNTNTQGEAGLRRQWMIHQDRLRHRLRDRVQDSKKPGVETFTSLNEYTFGIDPSRS